MGFPAARLAAEKQPSRWVLRIGIGSGLERLLPWLSGVVSLEGFLSNDILQPRLFHFPDTPADFHAVAFLGGNTDIIFCQSDEATIAALLAVISGQVTGGIVDGIGFHFGERQLAKRLFRHSKGV